MRILVTHGYLLTGSGSNVYVQNLCRALTGLGHEVHLVCQEPSPLDQDFVNESSYVSKDGIRVVESRKTVYPGRCVVYRPEIGDLLPVYVYDDYPGWRVKTFLDLSSDELERYLDLNVGALRTVVRATAAEVIVTNHSLPGPLIARRALESLDAPYLSIVHGSCLQYVARKSERYMEIARVGLGGARRIISPSPHGAATISEDFPELADRALALSGGVDTDLFRPDAFDPGILDNLRGGPGRGPEQDENLEDALAASKTDETLLETLKNISASYEPRSHDSDAAEKISRFVEGDGPRMIFVGKLIHSKGVHSLINALARMEEHEDTKLLIVGFGTFREGLEALVRALGRGNSESLERLARLGKRLEGDPAEPLEHFEVSGELLARAKNIEERVKFIGPLGHRELAKLVPAADVAVVPSIFPEIFGLVAAEFAACGVVPFVADHSGLAEAGEIVGQGLPLDLRVSTTDFEEKLARALASFLSLPEKERQECARRVRKNSVERLSWRSLAQDIVELAQTNP